MNLKGIVVIRKHTNDQWVAGNVTDVDDCIEVTWNSGKIEKFPEDTNDLLVYDIGPTGICHETSMCDGCKKQRMVGLRWRCMDCNDYDLCSTCYHSNAHSLEHTFKRIDVPGASPVRLPKRKVIQTNQIHGFYPGARVKRGKDWDWGNQDGGAGYMGTVQSVYNWEGPFKTENLRSGATILWDKNKHKANYRVGFNGKVDLICVTAAFGGNAYVSHLPTTKNLLSHKKKRQGREFNVGDSVVICKKIDTIIEAQNGHGGFSEGMVKSIGVVGKVLSHVMNGIVVSFDTTSKPVDVLALLFDLRVRQNREKWLVNPDILQKVDQLKPGEKVKVVDDKRTFILMQKNIGNYHPTQDTLIGEKVTIMKNDGEKVQIKYGQNEVYLSCGAVRNFDSDLGGEDLLGLLLEGMLRSALDDKKEKEQKVEEVKEKEKEQKPQAAASVASRREPKEYTLRELVEAQDDSGVRKFLNERPYMVNIFEQGSTCLHVAVFNNDTEIVDIFLEKNADLTIQDDNGDSVLHIAASKNFITIGRKLIRKKCPMNLKNKSDITPIGMAVLRKHENFVRMLVQEKCRTDIRDPNGNIPFHVACSSGNIDMVRILLNQEDLLIPNRVGLCGIHLAMAEKHKEILKFLIETFPEVLNSVIADGATPLHIAVRNGNENMVEFLLDFITDYRHDIDKKTRSGQTALHLACVEGFLSIVKVLLQHGAQIDAETLDGNTAVLMCVLKHQLLKSLPQQLQGHELRPDLRTVRSHFENTKASGIVVACYLLENGANLNHFNHGGQTVLDVCDDNVLTKLLCEFGKKHRVLEEPPSLPSKSKLNKQESELDYDPCHLCTDNKPVEGRFLPCGHAMFCYEHADSFKQCPHCKTMITGLSRLSVEKQPNCKLCREIQVNVTFEPCGHQLVCYDCSRTIKYCMTCDQKIAAKVPIVPIPEDQSSPEKPPTPRKPSNQERPVPAPRPPRRQSSSSSLSSTGSAASASSGAAASSVEDPNEKMLCNICWEFPKNIVFQCGHRCCKSCAYAIRECHMCRVVIAQRIKIYDN